MGLRFHISLSPRRPLPPPSMCVYGGQTGRLVPCNIYVGIIWTEVINLGGEEAIH